MSDVNSNGLKREIPRAVKREVRQRDGFGCVICGNTLITYEHFDPEFKDAFEHKTSGITLLYEQCQSKKTRGMLSLQTVRSAVKNPKAKQKRFSFEAFDVGGENITISIGTLHFRNVPSLIRILGETIFNVLPPETIGCPFLISAKITDTNGKPIFEIEDNKWKTFSYNWDVEVSGRRIKIKNGNADVAFIVRSEPPNKLVVETINMFHKGVYILGKEKQDIIVKSFNGTQMTAQGATFTGCQIGIDVRIFDLRIGVGGGMAIIESMTIGSGTQPQGSLSEGDPSLGLRRNNPCWCGSGRKLKKCHGRLQSG